MSLVVLRCHFILPLHLRRLNSTLNAAMPKPGFYAVHAGFKPGVYTTWNEAEAQLRGFKGKTIQKKFRTREEAEHFVKHGTTVDVVIPPIVAPPNPPQLPSNGSKIPRKSKSREEHDKQSAPVVIAPHPPHLKPPISISIPTPKSNRSKTSKKKKARMEKRLIEVVASSKSPSPSTTPTPTPSSSTSTFSPKVTSSPPTIDTCNIVHAYTDGACRGNGKVGVNTPAGSGVYWRSHSLIQVPKPISVRLPGAEQTNNRAELYAIVLALEHDPDPSLSLAIYSDSQYAINCVTIWFQNWRSRNWKTSAGEDVKNQDLIRYILELLRFRQHKAKSFIPLVQFLKVRGHSGNIGNAMADRLATNGSLLPWSPDILFFAKTYDLKSKLDQECGGGGGSPTISLKRRNFQLDQVDSKVDLTSSKIQKVQELQGDDLIDESWLISADELEAEVNG